MELIKDHVFDKFIHRLFEHLKTCLKGWLTMKLFNKKYCTKQQLFSRISTKEIVIKKH